MQIQEYIVVNLKGEQLLKLTQAHNSYQGKPSNKEWLSTAMSIACLGTVDNTIEPLFIGRCAFRL